MPHPALLFILLLLPNTTLRDWQRANAPHLHLLLREGDAALMNARTAERDTITPRAACRSLGAGARMDASSDGWALAYPVQPDNLGDSLRAHGVNTLCDDALACAVAGQGVSPGPLTPLTPDAPTLIVSDLGSDPANADARIGDWIKTARARHGEIMILSTNPSAAEYEQLNQLVPVVLWQQTAKPGFLYSSSTRHPGLVTNTDIAPTIAGDFSARLPGAAYGAATSSVPILDGNAAHLLEQANASWTAQARALRALPYLAGVMAAWIALVSYLAWRNIRGTGTLALLATFVPLVLLLSNAIPVAASLLISALGGAYVLRDQLRQGLMYASILTAALVTGDALGTGGQFTGASLLGYSPLEGARYYGVGNETMGAVIGAGVVLTAGLLTWRGGRFWCALIWIVITAALAWPTAGAKAGGLLVGLIALAALFAATSGRSWRDVRVWGSLVGALALGVAGLVLLGRYGQRSHLTQAVESAARHGSGVYGSLIVRKGLMDAHLVFHSVWIWVLIAASGGGYLAVRDCWKRLAENARASVAVGCAATAACLTLNDAGVVAAALCSLCLWALCVSLRTAERALSTSSPAA